MSTSLDDIWNEFVETRSPLLRDELITHYVPLVRQIVSRLGIPETSLSENGDLLSYGMIGLINAIDRFDPTRGARFETFAKVRIRGAVIDQLRTLNWLPRSVMTHTRQIEATVAKLEQQLGYFPREEEVAEEMGITLEQLRRMLHEAGIALLSLDAPIGSQLHEEELVSLGDLLVDQETPEPMLWLVRRESLQTLYAALAHLPERERLLLTRYYWEERTMKEISQELQVSESRVCQLHAQAMQHLRTQLREEPATSLTTSKTYSVATGFYSHHRTS